METRVLIQSAPKPNAIANFAITERHIYLGNMIHEKALI